MDTLEVQVEYTPAIADDTQAIAMFKERVATALRTRLGVSTLVVPITQRLGLGSVLGFLLAGMAIGPWGLGLIAAPKAILGFAEFGVVLLLFLVGLELNPRRLWTLRKAVLDHNVRKRSEKKASEVDD